MIVARRDLIIGAACLAAAGAAYQLKPRRRMSLLGAAKLADVLPAVAGDWTSTDVTDLVAPKTEGSLASRLYNQTVERVYRQNGTDAEVMMLIAYGDTQSNELQLHRPESCYPAFGFDLSNDTAVQLPLGPGVSIPARRLVADAPGRRENIIYWARLGDYLPVNDSEQRMDRLKAAMSGYIADGVLARFSVAGADPKPAWAVAEQCIVALIKAMPAATRNVLVGNARAKTLMTSGF